MSILKVATIKSLSSAAPVFQNSSGTEKGRLAKAYVNFDGGFGTSPFTIANGGIRTAYNVTSVTDTAKGRYTINFVSGTFTNTNYIAAGIAGNYNANTTNVFGIMPDGTRTVTAFPIRVRGGGEPADKPDTNLVFFGD